MTETQNNKQTVVILAAVRDEATQIIDRMSLIETGSNYIGQVGRNKIIVSVSGVGGNRAIDTLNGLIDSHSPDLIMHVGFAGGLDPTLAAGDVMRVRHVLNSDGAILSLGVGPPTTHDQSDERSSMHSLLTLNSVVDSPESKKLMFDQYNASAVDMETYYTASLDKERDIACLSIRAISDPADMALPAAALEWIKPDGTPDMAKVMSYVATHPWVTPTLMKLQGYATAAARKLAEAVQLLLTE